MTEPADEVLFERRGGIGLITLNRPKALNAFTLGMYHLVGPQLAVWSADPAIQAVVVRGAGGKAFCAGGDIRALWDTGPGITGPDDLKSRFFRDEYRVIRQVHRLNKPYIALMNGITMGGGVGMSVNGAVRVATDNTLFAMPESAIGLIPDVGGTRFLALCPGKLGLYLGLTGARLKAADLLYAGLATHFVPAAGLDELVDALAVADWSNGDPLSRLLDAFAGDPGPVPLAEQRAAIDRCFGQESLGAIFAALAAEPGDWAQAALASLKRFSPTSLGLIFRQLPGSPAPEIEQALTLEFGLVQLLMSSPDFFEGVRAVLVDKDQAPKWRPPTIEALDQALLDRRFAEASRVELDLAAPAA